MKIFIKVTPGARKEAVRMIEEGRYEVDVGEPPLKGRANKAALRLLAKYFSVANSEVKLVSGHKSRRKVIVIKKHVDN